MKSGPRGFNNFKSAYCMKYAVPAERYERRVFWHCLHSRGTLVAHVLIVLYPRFFRRDLLVIREVADAVRPDQISTSLQRYHHETQNNGGFLRRKLKVRISGERLMRLGFELLGEA